MEQRKIRSIIKEKVNDLAKLGDRIGDDFDKETIHDFRVTAKTLRSYLRLLRMHSDKPKLKLSKSFKRLYHIAGAIRDTQLELEKMEVNQTVLPHYFDKLHKVLHTQKKEWKKHYSKKVLHKLEHRLTDHKFEEIDAGTLATFFNLRMAAIDELSKVKTPTDNHIHSIRKRAKDILYNVKIAKKTLEDTSKNTGQVPANELSKLADVIGDYNDKRLTLEHLNSFSSRTMEPTEQRAIRTICLAESKQLKAEKKNIAGMVRQLYTVVHTGEQR